MKDLLVFKLISITAVLFFGGFGFVAHEMPEVGFFLVALALITVTAALLVTIKETLSS